MLPLAIFIVVSLVARVAGLIAHSIDSWTWAIRIGLAVMFLFMATAHFHPKRRPGLVNMVPTTLPHREALVTATGILEILGGIGLLITQWNLSRLAAAGLFILMFLMFPANIRASRVGQKIGNYKTTPLLPRTLIQIVFCLSLGFIALS